MLEGLDLQPAEKALDKARVMMSKIQESSFSWPDRETFEEDLEATSTLLAEMQQALSGLVVQLSGRTNIFYGRGLAVQADVGEAINKSYYLLSRLYDDLHVIEDDGPTGKDTFDRARVHFQQIESHYAATRNWLLALKKKYDMDR